MVVDRAFVEGQKSFQRQTFEKLDLTGLDLSRKEFTQCLFKGTTLHSTVWKAVALEDCVFERCDLANLRLASARFGGVEFKDCKLLGSAWSDLGTNPMLTFTDCAMRYASFSGVNLRGCRFTRCSLVDATLVDVDLSKVPFKDCDFTKALFERCTLAATDLSTSTGLYFDASKNRAKGARIPVETAALIASALGLVVAGYD